MMGYPASGRTTWVNANLPGYRRLDRELEGGTLDSLLPKLFFAIKNGENVVLDDDYPSVASRRPLFSVTEREGVSMRCVWLTTSIEDAQRNAVHHLVSRYGHLPSPDELRTLVKTDPLALKPHALFAYRKQFEKPTTTEGFASVDTVTFVRDVVRTPNDRRAVIFDYDGTLRTTKSGEKYPRHPDDVLLLPGRKEKLARLSADGWLLLGVSNQGDVSRGKLSEADAMACFERTQALLGAKIETRFCPHNPAPISCWCRKPMPGFGVEFCVRHGLDAAKCVMVGDRTTDETFASRAGFVFESAESFFGV